MVSWTPIEYAILTYAQLLSSCCVVTSYNGMNSKKDMLHSVSYYYVNMHIKVAGGQVFSMYESHPPYQHQHHHQWQHRHWSIMDISSASMLVGMLYQCTRATTGWVIIVIKQWVPSTNCVAYRPCVTLIPNKPAHRIRKNLTVLKIILYI